MDATEPNTPCVTSPNDFTLFQSTCERVISLLNLRDYAVYYRHGYPDGDTSDWTDSLALCCYNTIDMTATIFLCPDWGKVMPSAVAIRTTAAHEVLELLLARISMMAKDRDAHERDVIQATHQVIRRLEYLLSSSGLLEENTCQSGQKTTRMLCGEP
uniref:Uncharacterized protein n=1 Tax=viral metagenome TaxID=1070528 RepID=A0A6M3JKP0_9ZZZZ